MSFQKEVSETYKGIQEKVKNDSTVNSQVKEQVVSDLEKIVDHYNGGRDSFPFKPRG